MKILRIECDACGGTGLYSGMCEAAGQAVVCLDCSGTGCKNISYEPYTGRKRKRGVKGIRFSRGRLIVSGVGGTGKPMTYAEFEATIPEERT